VAEGGVKPESTLGLSVVDEPIRKIATSIVTSDELLDDGGPSVSAYVNSRLTLFVTLEEERQLLRGTAGGNEIQGILTSRGVPVYAAGTAAGSKVERLFKAAMGVRGSAHIEPSGFVIHPTDWEEIRLSKDSADQYYGGGPFGGAYGGPASQAGMFVDSLWNRNVALSSHIGAGTALVVSRDAMQVYRRGGISVEATNSHSDYFVRNLMAIRAEERLGLAVYRPGGLCEVRFT
jgi:HK97 family phage major capsid protein